MCFIIGNSRVERCCTEDLTPNISIFCLPPSRVDPEVQGLKIIIDCPQPGHVVLERHTGLLQSARGLHRIYPTNAVLSLMLVSGDCVPQRAEHA